MPCDGSPRRGRDALQFRLPRAACSLVLGLSATLAGGDLWAGAIEGGAGKTPASASAAPPKSSQLKWRSPKSKRTARAAKSKPSAPQVEADSQASLELRSATGSPVVAAKFTEAIDDDAPKIVLTTAEEPVVDPFDDPFEDRKPKQAKPSELKLFPVIRAAQLRPIDPDEIEESEPAAPIELDAFDQIPAEETIELDAFDQIPAEETPADETAPREITEEQLPPARSEGDAAMPGEDEFAQNPAIQAEKCPTPRDLKPISEITNKIAAEPGLFPQECALSDEPFQPRRFARTDFTWKASALCHKPLYFEQPGVERYGHTWGPFLQPVVGSAHFFGSVILLPYNMGVEPPWECVYPLGHYRPGSCAPYTVGPIPLSLRGVAAQAGATLGFVYIFAP